MSNTATELNTRNVVQEVGVVVRADDKVLLVRTESGDHRAKRAVSCLVEPQQDDFVLLSIVGASGSYVLAVLERDSEVGTRLTVDGDLEIKLAQGSFAVSAKDGVKVVSGKDVSVVSGALNVNAVDGNVALQRLTYVGQFIRSEVEKIKSIAGTFDSVLDRFSQRVKRSYRTVEQIDQLKAERVDYSAKKLMRFHGNNTVMTAKELVKVDGEQIHLG